MHGSTEQSFSAPKDETEMIENVHIDILPEPLRVEGGLVVIAEGLTSTTNLKLSKDGHTVLIPQPSDHEADCLRWSSTKKHLVLFTVAWGALCADFVGAIGSAPIIFQSVEWDLPLSTVNRPNSIVVLLLGLFGLVWIPMASYWGRAPVLFWTELIGFCFTLGTAVSTNFSTFFVMRAMSAIFLTAAQTVALAFLKDMFFFHERARKIGLWACMYICSPYIGPMLGNFVVGKTSEWQHVYWMATGVVALQVILVIAFIDETWFNRSVPVHEQPERPSSFSARMSRLLGIWQVKNHDNYFLSIKGAYRMIGLVILQPNLALIAASYFLLFMWSIGINITTTIIFAVPVSLGGYGYDNVGLGYLYFAPIVGTILAEIFGHYFNDFLARRYVLKHGGVFKPEVRLWPVYIAAIFNIPGIVLVGQAIYHHLNVAAVVFGWGMFGFGVMLSSVSVTAYALDSFPMAPAEVAAWLNLSRTIGGFAVGEFQGPWVEKSGYDVSFGIQGVVVALSVLPVLVVHAYGQRMRLHTARQHPNSF